MVTNCTKHRVASRLLNSFVFCFAKGYLFNRNHECQLDQIARSLGSISPARVSDLSRRRFIGFWQRFPIIYTFVWGKQDSPLVVFMDETRRVLFCPSNEWPRPPLSIIQVGWAWLGSLQCQLNLNLQLTLPWSMTTTFIYLYTYLSFWPKSNNGRHYPLFVLVMSVLQSDWPTGRPDGRTGQLRKSVQSLFSGPMNEPMWQRGKRGEATTLLFSLTALVIAFQYERRLVGAHSIGGWAKAIGIWIWTWISSRVSMNTMSSSWISSFSNLSPPHFGKTETESLWGVHAEPLIHPVLFSSPMTFEFAQA